MLQNACPFSCTDDAADVLPSVVEVGQKIRQCLHSFCNHQTDVSELLTWSNFSCLTGCLVNEEHSKCGERNNQTNIMAEVFSCIFTSSPTAQNQLAFTYKSYGGAITKLGDSNKTAHIFDPESWWTVTSFCPGCFQVSNPSGISYQCTRLDFGSGQHLLYFATGRLITFNITALVRDCVGQVCFESQSICNTTCTCCVPFQGGDPGFLFTLVAPKYPNSSYTQYLNCSIPPLADANGHFGVACNFSGQGMASLLIQVQFRFTWTQYLPLFSFIPLYVTAGDAWLPACSWKWDLRNNSFPAQTRGILQVYLNDAYGNPVSTATGADYIPLTFNWVIQFTNKADHTNVTADVIPPPQIVNNLSGGYYSVIIICFREGKYSVYVANDRNESVPNMPADFIVTKANPSARASTDTHLGHGAVSSLPTWKNSLACLICYAAWRSFR